MWSLRAFDWKTLPVQACVSWRALQVSRWHEYRAADTGRQAQIDRSIESRLDSMESRRYQSGGKT